MNASRAAIQRLLSLAFVCLLGSKCFSFALLGPYEDWMQYSNGMKFAGDIGGPKPLGSEYRWNVPVITYGFDQSFMDFFGAEGKAAVDAAIQILNKLPRASRINLNNYSKDPRRWNLAMKFQGVRDLKSETMHLLLERLGLASPVRSIYTIREDVAGVIPPGLECCPWRWSDYWGDWYDAHYPRRNYDPDTLAPSPAVNGFVFFGSIVRLGDSIIDFSEIPLDPTRIWFSSVADDQIFGEPMYGVFYTGLSRDDVGGLRYLLNVTNVNYEFLLPDVRGRGLNAAAWVNGAWRPGVEKITFTPQPYDSRQAKWLTAIHQYTDTYMINGIVKHQKLERVVTKPDILFSAGNNGEGSPYSFDAARADTSHWQNNAFANSNAEGTGPGVICPPTVFRFHKSAPPYAWGRIDGTNMAKVFPVSSYSGQGQLEVNLSFYNFSGNIGSVTLKEQYPIGAVVVLQHSTNAISWAPLTVITNMTGVVDWSQYGLERQEFFRVVPAP